MITSREQIKKKPDIGIEKPRGYNEVVDFLDSLKTADYSEASLERMKKLDVLCDNICSKIDLILVGGTNGKSSTIHFASKLLCEEGLKVGALLSTHLLTYNERIVINFETISNKVFTESVNTIITLAQQHDIHASSHEILIIATLLYFKTEKVNVALIEVNYGGRYDATAYLSPKIAAVTRVVEDSKGLLSNDLDEVAIELLGIAKPKSWFISSEQSKLRLQKMKTWCDIHNILWAMPIRKLASLPYIYEQLYGRIASLGERIAQIYIEDIKGKFSPFLRGNLLATQKGQRGRPTLEAKRFSELNPIKTFKSFWLEHFDLLKGRFDLLDKEKPSILLDNASNLDALSNLFLGIRLLHYQKPLQGLAIILGISKAVNATEAIKLIRYLLKKVPGQVFFIPLPENTPSHNCNDLTIIAKELNVKAKACLSLTDAFEQAAATVDERDGVVVISGSNTLIAEYWKLRGIKKF